MNHRAGEPFFIDIGSSHSFLEDGGLPALVSLIATAEEIVNLKKGAQTPNAVVLVQDTAASDATNSWLTQLKSTLLFDDLLQRMVKFYYLCELVRQSPVPWFYVAKGDVKDSFFELALSCRLLVTTQPVSLGFHGIEAGIFPWAGGLHKTYEKNTKGLLRWLQKPTIQSDCCKLDNVLVVGFITEDIRTTLAPYLSAAIAAHKTVKLEDPVVLENLRSLVHGGMQLFKVAANLEEQTSADPWDFYLDLLKKSRKDVASIEKVKVFIQTAAHQLLSQGYTNHLQRQLQLPRPVEVDTASARPSHVYIDLTFVVPPAEPLLKLIKAGARVTFFSENHEELRRGLELAYSLIERTVGFDKAQEYWTLGVTWFLAKPGITYEPVLRWSLDDKVSLEDRGSSLEMLRVAGNRGRAPCGICEWDGNNQDQTVGMAVIDLMSDAVVRVKKFSNPVLSLTIMARSVIFEDLVRCAQQTVEPTISALERTGWRALGSQGFWNRFLAGRHGIQPVAAADLRFGPISLSQAAFDVGLWKEVQELVRNLNYEKPPNPNPVFISRHFATLSGLLTAMILKHGYLDSQETADLFMTNVVGIPKEYATPLSFLRRTGQLRVRRYAECYWPELIPCLEAVFP